jgi:hypothetical protein
MSLSLCPIDEDPIEVVKSYIKVGTDHVVSGTGPSPHLIRLIKLTVFRVTSDDFPWVAYRESADSRCHVSTRVTV